MGSTMQLISRKKRTQSHGAMEFGPRLNSHGKRVLVINTALGFARKQIEYYSKLSVMVLVKEGSYIN